MKKLILLFFIILLNCIKAKPQESNFPKVGAFAPEIHLEKINDFRVNDISLSKLKGKHIIIDLWHRNCATCLKSFPKINAMHEKYKDKIDFFLLGLEDKQGLERFYLLAKERYNMSIPWIIDSTLYRSINPTRAAPYIIWIDNFGEVKAITSSISENQIEKFIENQRFDYKSIENYNENFLNLENDASYGNKGQIDHNVNNLFRSYLKKWNSNEDKSNTFPANIKQALRWAIKANGKFEGVVSLESLFQFAYFGTRAWTNTIKPDRFGDTSVYRSIYRNVIYELNEDEFSNFNVNFNTGQHLYYYYIEHKGEIATEEEYLNQIRQDLAQQFDYEVIIENKFMPYWSLNASQETIQKLISQGQEKNRENNFSANWQSFINWPFEEFIEQIFKKVYFEQPPIINETGFYGNIDIKINDSLLSDFSFIVNALNKVGIILTLKEKPFKVLIIKSR